MLVLRKPYSLKTASAGSATSICRPKIPDQMANDFTQLVDDLAYAKRPAHPTGKE